MPSSIDVICFECMTPSRHPPSAAGNAVTCANPNCGSTFVVPDPGNPCRPNVGARKALADSPKTHLKRTRIMFVIGGAIIAVIAVISIGLHINHFDTQMRDQDAQNLCQIHIGLIGMGESFGPGGIDDIRDKNGKALLSWRVKALLFIEQNHLYNQFHTNEPWDSPHNLSLLDSMPKTYLDRSNPNGPKNMTRCLLIRGPGMLFEGPKSDPFAKEAIPDGAASTIMLVHSAHLVPWTKPEDIEYSPDTPLPAFSKARPDGFLAVFADGTVRSIPHDTDEAKIRAMLTPRGGESVSLDEFKVNTAAAKMKASMDEFRGGMFGPQR